VGSKWRNSRLRRPGDVEPTDPASGPRLPRLELAFDLFSQEDQISRKPPTTTTHKFSTHRKAAQAADLALCLTCVAGPPALLSKVVFLWRPALSPSSAAEQPSDYW
jgi:hypothetical protein